MTRPDLEGMTSVGEALNSHSYWVRQAIGAFDDMTRVTSRFAGVGEQLVDDAFVYTQTLSPAYPDEECIVVADNKVRNVVALDDDGKPGYREVKVYFYSAVTRPDQLYVSLGSPEEDRLPDGFNGFDFILSEDNSSINRGPGQKGMGTRQEMVTAARQLAKWLGEVQKGRPDERTRLDEKRSEVLRGHRSRVLKGVLALAVTAGLSVSAYNVLTTTPEEAAEQEAEREANRVESLEEGSLLDAIADIEAEVAQAKRERQEELAAEAREQQRALDAQRTIDGVVVPAVDEGSAWIPFDDDYDNSELPPEYIDDIRRDLRNGPLYADAGSFVDQLDSPGLNGSCEILNVDWDNTTHKLVVAKVGNPRVEMLVFTATDDTPEGKVPKGVGVCTVDNNRVSEADVAATGVIIEAQPRP